MKWRNVVGKSRKHEIRKDADARKQKKERTVVHTKTSQGNKQGTADSCKPVPYLKVAE
jgi:hypothetical protein